MAKIKATRAERQAQTKESLIIVARRMFLRDGYAATSLDKVALEAGFSKGAVYSNFAGKEELCMAALDLIHEEKIQGVLSAFTQESTLDSKIKSFIEWAREATSDPRWAALEVEFAAVARHNEWVAAELVKRHREIRTAIAELIEHVTAEAGLKPVQPAERTAAMLFSAGIGLGALRSLDPSVDVELFADVMRSFIRPDRSLSVDRESTDSETAPD